MNVLSLRINAVKSDEGNKRRSGDLLELDIETFWSDEVKELLMIVNNSKITELQIREFKKFAQLISPENPRTQNEQIAKKLIRIYFNEKVKHPAKSSIQGCFNLSLEQELIVDCFKQEIATRINSIDFSSPESCYHFVSVLNEASQNFIPAIKAIGQMLRLITEFFKKLILLYDQQLKTELSPSQKNEVTFQLHSALQAVIFCTRTHLNVTEDIEETVRENLEKIVGKCDELLDNEEIPMDTKNNCSLLIVMLSKLTSNNTYKYGIKNEESSYGKRLSLIFGIINTLTASNLDLQLLADISIILKKIFIKSSVDKMLMLSVCRSFMQQTKKLASFELTESPQLETIAVTSLSVAVMSLESTVDSCKHLGRETLEHLTLIGEKLYGDTITDKIFAVISNLSTINQQSIVIISISSSMEAKKILVKMPKLLESLLASIDDNKVTNHNVVNCYEALVMKMLEGTEFNEWFRSFIEPVLVQIQHHKPQSEERLILENLLIRFTKKEKRILDEILKRRAQLEIGLVLLCLSSGKKTGCFDKLKSTESLWKGIMSFEDIKTAMINDDDSVRISAFMLVADSRKVTDAFTAEEFDCFIFFLKYNINVQSPETRQNIYGLVKNAFVRIQAILQSLVRKRDTQGIEFYFEFLRKLQEFCLENLFEGANFTRRALSLRILFYILEAIAQWLPEKSAEIWTQQKFDVLMNVFNDSFEANKEMAIEIMKLIPKPVARKFCDVTLSQLETMVTSIRPPENLTSSYLMEVYVKFTFNFEDFKGEAKPQVAPETFLMLSWCEKLILSGLHIAEKSLVVASNKNPMYPLVQSFRHLLAKVDLDVLGVCPFWQDFFKRLLVLSRRLTLAVAPVVNNSSPEGILPNEEIEGIDDETRAEWETITENTTPQIILLCSWRTIKEVSLLLGDICLKAPLINDDGVGLLSVDQVLSIGDHFLELLSKTKHRGAFEQCFFGFSQLCLRLWKCQEPELHKLPSEMLNQMITSISGSEKEANELLTMKNLCATRRSAGLPFMIQALITSELKVATNKNFHFVMKNLLQFCREGEFLETRTHSLNILRALFRCSDLNEAIGEYVAEGMKCAILGYGADSWIERNSSTLLFSALMVRIFGVQRTKDSEDLGIKNKMTGRTFFWRYPELYDFIMTQLQEAAEFVADIKMNSKLHPLLLLLIRLYPSSLDGSQNKLELTGFVPVVSSCSGCVEMQTRILCAKFIASCTPQELLSSRILQSIEIIRSEKLPANVSHGILLQILHLVKVMPAATAEDDQVKFIDILEQLINVVDGFKKQALGYSACLDIVIEAMMKILTAKKLKSETLIRYLDKCLEFEQTGLFGLPLVLKNFFLIKLMKHIYGDCTPLIAPQKDGTAAYSFDMNSFLNLSLMVLDFNYAVSMKDEYEIDPREMFIIENCPRDRLLRLTNAMAKNEQQISISQELNILNDGTMYYIVDEPISVTNKVLSPCEVTKKMLLLQIVNRNYLQSVKAFDILSMMPYALGDFTMEGAKELIKDALNLPEQFKKSLLKYANTVIFGECAFKEVDFKFLVEISTDASYFVKSAAADFVESLADHIEKFYASKFFDTILYFAKSVLLLLMDDEHEIRERTTKIVLQISNNRHESVVPGYAQELFLDSLLRSSDEVYLTLAIITLIVVDGSKGDNSLDEGILEYRVFEKNEVNIFSETFIVKKHCSNLLKKKFQHLVDNGSNFEEIVAKIVEESQKFQACRNIAVIESFLLSCL